MIHDQGILVFGQAEGGRIVHVDEVVRGKKCSCRCPVCRDRLIARQGEIRIHHFAHESESECPSSVETVLHLAAKQLIQDKKKVLLPKLTVWGSSQIAGYGIHRVEKTIPEIVVDLDQVELEKSLSGIRPDIFSLRNEQPLLVEIAVHHIVDEEKEQKIRELGISAIEIRLDSRIQDWDWKSLEEAVIYEPSNRHWIFSLEAASLKVQADQEASQFSPPVRFSKPQTSRTRIFVRRVLVDLLELPWGQLAVWSVYNPEVNDLIKKIVKRYSGQWSWQYKNWIIPKPNKERAKRELLSLADS